jgi:hypothetical protein
MTEKGKSISGYARNAFRACKNRSVYEDPRRIGGQYSSHGKTKGQSTLIFGRHVRSRSRSNRKTVVLVSANEPLTDICGAYEISLKRIAWDTGIDKAMVLKILTKFESAGKITFRDGWILIHNFIKNQSNNPSTLKGIERSLSECPDWIRDTLQQAPNSLRQLGLLNLTQLNPTQPNQTQRYGDAACANDPRRAEDTTECQHSS